MRRECYTVRQILWYRGTLFPFDFARHCSGVEAVGGRRGKQQLPLAPNQQSARVHVVLRVRSTRLGQIHLRMSVSRIWKQK